MLHQHSSSHTNHDHHDHFKTSAEQSGKILLISMLINLAIPICQIIGGIIAQSMAVISDAVHNFSDFTGLLIAYGAYLISRKPPSMKFSFGFRRAEILSALFNVSILFGASFFIIIEAVSRMQNPQPVSGALVIALAGVGILGNGISAMLLYKGSKVNLNIRSAFLHMFADLLTSFVVLFSGIFILFIRPWYWLDPLLSILIVFFIVKSSWSVFKESGRILMEGTPPGIDIDQLRRKLEEFPEVINVHHLHVWNVGYGSTSFSCHVLVQDQKLSELDTLTAHMREFLSKEFGIKHSVFEFEHTSCGKDDILCQMEHELHEPH